MRRITAITLTAIGAALVAACGGANEPANDSEADTGAAGTLNEAPAVPMVDINGNIIGEVRGGDSDDGANLMIDARGLPPGVHGLHIHETGLCEPPGFQSAGGHWNPTGAEHGGENPQGAHLGDLQNVTVGEDGVLRAEIVVPGTYLRNVGRDTRAGARQILDASGAALVLHAQADDYRTDPSGDSGDRIACAVLGSPGPGAVTTDTAAGNSAATNASTTNASTGNMAEGMAGNSQ